MSMTNHPGQDRPASRQRSPATWSPGVEALPQGALASLARALQHILERTSGTVMRHIVGLADEHGVDGLYVAVLIMRERTAWPAMRSEDRNALELARRLLAGFAMLPNTSYMQVPPAEVEVLVDRILISVAQWSRQRLSAELKREYMALLEEYGDRLRPLLEVSARGDGDPLVARPAVTIALMESFERWLATSASLPARRPMLAILEGLFLA